MTEWGRRQVEGMGRKGLMAVVGAGEKRGKQRRGWDGDDELVQV